MNCFEKYQKWCDSADIDKADREELLKIAGDEKEIKQKRKPFIQRLIAAVIVLILPILINAIMSTLAKDKSYIFFNGFWIE